MSVGRGSVLSCRRRGSSGGAEVATESGSAMSMGRAYFLALLLWHTTRAHGSQSDLTSRFTALASLAAHAVLPDRGVDNLGGAFSEMGVPVESEYIGGGGSSKADRDGSDMSSMFKDIFVPWTVGVDCPWDLSSSSHTFYNEGWTLASVSGKEE